MKNYRIRIIAWLLCCLLLLVPVKTQAAGAIDLGGDVSLELNCVDKETPIAGVEFNIYLIASFGRNGELITESEFVRFDDDIQSRKEDTWRILASTLKGYVLRDKLTPADSGVTDENGKLFFPATQSKLTPGLYLVIGQRHVQNGILYTQSPYLVALPGLNPEDGNWIYDVKSNTKHESEPEPEEPEALTVIKIWKDEGHEEERPKEVVVQLLRDGEIFDTVILNRDNGWKYTWENLDSAYEWTIVEKELPDYLPSVTQEGMVITVTNTYMEDLPDEEPPKTDDPGEPDEPTPTPHPGNPNHPNPPSGPGTPDEPTDLPQTGQLWWPVPLLLAVSLLLLIIGLYLRRTSDE